MKEYPGTYEEIMQGCTRGKRCAQAAFYDMFATGIHAVSYRMLGNGEEAEDVVQEILLRTLTNVVLLVPDYAGMVRRLRRMTINECIDRLRKKHIVWEELDAETDICDETDIDNYIVQEERSKVLHQAIESLPPQSRTVLQLAVIEEMDYDEIASLLHISASGVRAHLTRAKQKLVNYFKK